MFLAGIPVLSNSSFSRMYSCLHSSKNAGSWQLVEHKRQTFITLIGFEITKTLQAAIQRVNRSGREQASVCKSYWRDSVITHGEPPFYMSVVAQYSLSCQTFLQGCVLPSTLKHHEETRLFTAVAEGWREGERGVQKSERTNQQQKKKKKGNWLNAYSNLKAKITIKSLPFFTANKKTNSYEQTETGPISTRRNPVGSHLAKPLIKPKPMFPCSYED